MAFDIDLLARSPDLRALPAWEARVAVTLRLWVVMNKLGRCPLQAMAEKLESRRAAAHLHLMLEEVGAAWPEPASGSPPAACGFQSGHRPSPTARRTACHQGIVWLATSHIAFGLWGPRPASRASSA